MQLANDINITDCEWEVMRVVWTFKAATSRQIIDILEQKYQFKPTTTKTYLSRLVKKGALSTIKKGREYIYQAQFGEQAANNQAVQNIFNQLCAKTRGHTLINLVESTELAKDDIEDLLNVLQKKVNGAPTQVPCDCTPDCD